jgi:hypothetical protein
MDVVSPLCFMSGAPINWTAVGAIATAVAGIGTIFLALYSVRQTARAHREAERSRHVAGEIAFADVRSRVRRAFIETWYIEFEWALRQKGFRDDQRAKFEDPLQHMKLGIDVRSLAWIEGLSAPVRKSIVDAVNLIDIHSGWDSPGIARFIKPHDTVEVRAKTIRRALLPAFEEFMELGDRSYLEEPRAVAERKEGAH